MSKKTFLHDKHVELGAKMTEFAGWDMPVQYTGIIDEHNTVRTNVGLFDVSHMGEVIVSGNDAIPFLQKIVPQNIGTLKDSKAVYCQLTNKQGGIIDDLIIYKLEDKRYLLILNASRIDEDLNWMVRQKRGFDVSIENHSHNYSLLAIQGPKASDLIEKLGINKDIQPEFFHIKRVEIHNINLLAARTGYTGEDGFELLVQNDYSELLWDYIVRDGAEFGLKPIGLGARDTLRLEAALPLYGNDLDENTTPIEAKLGWSVPSSKTANYNGEETIKSQKENGTEKELVGFIMTERAIPRHEYGIYYNGEKAGIVTSGGYSPTLNENIGLGYVNTALGIKTDTIIQISIRNKMYNAKVVKRPFVEKKNKLSKVHK